MNIGVFVELERIKKPSILMHQTCSMFCLFVNIFRDKPLDVDFSNWNKVHQYINTSITKYITEILTNIKNKILSDFANVM
jgi:lipoate synthase